MHRIKFVLECNTLQPAQSATFCILRICMQLSSLNCMLCGTHWMAQSWQPLLMYGMLYSWWHDASHAMRYSGTNPDFSTGIALWEVATAKVR
jgi:hypothetical protein